MRTFFGANSISDTQKAELRDLLADAIESADILGLSHINKPQYLVIHHAVEKLQLNTGQIRCNANIHRFIGETSFLEVLLKEKEFLGLITSRNVRKNLESRFKLRQIDEYLIPTEAISAPQGTPVARHYPDRFEQVMETLSVPFPGAIFLVGGGPLGKSYCKRVKDLGGIALDLGSVFDVWAGLKTRRWMDDRMHREVLTYNLD